MRGEDSNSAGPLDVLTPPPADLPLRSVYVHAPFCPRRCVYCDFAVTVSRSPDPAPWLNAVGREWEGLLRQGPFTPAPVLHTLFVGGGTPSQLGGDAMAGLAGILGGGRLSAPELEWTAEANPESFTREVADGWARAGVNRVSLGAQSFDPEVLKWMGRLHGPGETAAALRRARAAGVEKLSLDLIFGLPEEVERNWRKDLEEALALDVPHLSLYGLTIEEGTALGRASREGRVTPCEEVRYEEEFLLASELLAGAGYRQYELSNFARPGHPARHNLVYWDHRPYLGLGNGAHSFRHRHRRWNLRSWEAYEEAVREGRSPVQSQEELAPEQIRLERVWLGLRSQRGVALQGLPEPALERATSWVRSGLAVEIPGGIRLTPRGWLLLDRLAVELDGELSVPTPSPPASSGR